MTSLIDLPFFGLSELPAFETRAYDDGKVRIEVQPGRRGLATIWDKNILNYSFQVMQSTGSTFSARVRLRADDFFAACVFSSLDQSVHGLQGALYRLQSTSIRTIIENEKGERETRLFSWIHTANMQTRVEDGKIAVDIIEMELADWVWQPIFRNDKTSRFLPAVFTVTSGLSWRVNDLVNRLSGLRKRWSISLVNLGNKLGYLAVEHQIFSQEIQKILVTNNLPDFRISITYESTNNETLPINENDKEIYVIFTRSRSNRY